MGQLTAQLQHNGVTYRAETCVIERTRLGRNDHSLFTADLTVDFGGSGTGVTGGIVLDDKPAAREIGAKRPGTAFGMNYIMAIIDTVVGEYASWEDLKGKRCLALFKPEDTMNHGFQCQGIASIDGKRVMIFSDVEH